MLNIVFLCVLEIILFGKQVYWFGTSSEDTWSGDIDI